MEIDNDIVECLECHNRIVIDNPVLNGEVICNNCNFVFRIRLCWMLENTNVKNKWLLWDVNITTNVNIMIFIIVILIVILEYVM